MIKCIIDNSDKTATIYINDGLEDVLSLEESLFIKEENEESVAYNILKIISKLSVHLKLNYNAKSEKTLLCIDDEYTYSLLKPNGEIISKMTKAMKKKISDNELKLLLGSTLYELSMMENCDIELTGNDSKNNDKEVDVMDKNMDNNESFVFEDDSEDNNGLSFTNINKNENYSFKNLSKKDSVSIESEYDSDSPEYTFEDDEEYTFEDDSEYTFENDDDYTADENINLYSSNDDNGEVNIYGFVNEDVDMYNSNDEDINIYGTSDEYLENYSFDNKEEDSFYSLDDDVNVYKSTEGIEDESSGCEKDDVININYSNEVESSYSTNYVEDIASKLVDNKSNGDELSSISMSISVDSVEEEFKFLFDYISKKIDSIQEELNNIENSYNPANLNIQDLSISEEELMENFKKSMEIRLRLKVIKKSFTIYNNLKEQLDKEINKQ